MDSKILGLHHITAIAGSAKRNYDFYTNVLGLRLVKKTVNFDDPGTYHFYFGDEVGSPGSILTFFPWESVSPGSQGSGQATEVVYAVPRNSLDFWKKRLEESFVHVTGSGKRFGEDFLSFKDPDGLPITLIEPSTSDDRKGWQTTEVSAEVAIKGFHSVTLSLNHKGATQHVLELLGYSLAAEEQNRYRFVTDTIATAGIVDILEVKEPRGHNAAGTIHHVAFRVKDEAVQAAIREKIVKAGYQITPKIDRNYFFSLYFREPGGVLFEIATDNPGFAVDESINELGTHLMLPAQYESSRKRIEEVLPVL